MLQITLLFVILTTSVIVAHKHGLFSIVGVGLVGLAAYSVPSLTGFTYAYDLDGILRPASDQAIFIHVVFWLPFFLIVAFSKKSNKKIPFDQYKMSATALACLYVSLILYLWIAIKDGPLYFLGNRQIGEEQIATIAKIIWAWVVAFGLIAALVSRRFLLLACFIAMALINLIAGDRGMPIFIILSIIIINLNNYSILSIIKNIRIFIYSIIILIIVFMAKPIYQAIKIKDYKEILNFLSETLDLHFIKSFEPFVIHNTLELVIEDGFTYEISYLFKGILGQLLLIPSLLGISSAEWNRQFQDFLNQDLGYGIAYSYMAQAYSIGGLLCVIIFAAIFAFGLIFLNKIYQRLSGLAALLVLQLGVVWGVFIYRNSLENIIAIFRQIFIACILIFIVYYIITTIRSMTAPPASQRLNGYGQSRQSCQSCQS